MSRRVALILLFAGMALAVVGAYAGASLAGAGNSVFVLFAMLVLCLGAHLSSRIVMHYGASGGQAEEASHNPPASG